MDQLNHRIALAHQLADVSASVIRRYFRQANLPTQTKAEETSPIVTVADQEAEDAMVTMIRQNAPQDGIIREEGANIPSENGLSWVLDPIDGTASFVRGLPIFGTLIGLVETANPQPLLGIVNQPILQERWLGVRQTRTLWQNQPIDNPYTAQNDCNLADACLISTTPLMFITEKQQKIVYKLQNICRRTAFGGDCYNYVALASGWSAMPMVILEADVKYYDFCALIPIIEGCGAIISDWQGKALTSQSTEILATSNKALWHQALSVIQG